MPRDISRRVRAAMGIRAADVTKAAMQMEIMPSYLEAVLVGRCVPHDTRKRITDWCDQVDRIFDRAIPKPEEMGK